MVSVAVVNLFIHTNELHK